jgi:hypothetical protein
MFVRKLTAVQDRSLEVVERRRQALVVAEGRYEKAMIEAFRSGVPVVAIAEVLGQTEAGVRNWLRRRGYRRDDPGRQGSALGGTEVTPPAEIPSSLPLIDPDLGDWEANTP